jgi:hypothetical protein
MSLEFFQSLDGSGLIPVAGYFVFALFHVPYFKNSKNSKIKKNS